MKIILTVLAVLVLWTAMFGLVVLGNRLFASTGYVKVYNCSISEISPDFTTAMREECRKLRKEQK